MTDISRAESIKLAIQLFGIFLIVLAIISLSKFLSHATYFALPAEFYSISAETSGSMDEIFARIDVKGIVRKTALKNVISSGIFTVVYLLGGGYFLRGADFVQNILSTSEEEQEDKNETRAEG